MMGDAGHANASDALRAELATLRARALRKRAEAAPGVTEEQMDGAEDAADPTAALIELIVKAELPGSEMSPDSLRRAELEAELSALKPRVLRDRAEATPGVTEEQLDAAEAADNPELALIEIIVQLELQAEGDHKAKQAALEAELKELKPRALRKRASSTPGVSEEQLDAALEAADSKAALIALILHMELPDPTPAGAPLAPLSPAPHDLMEPEPEHADFPAEGSPMGAGAAMSARVMAVEEVRSCYTSRTLVYGFVDGMGACNCLPGTRGAEPDHRLAVSAHPPFKPCNSLQHLKTRNWNSPG
jgi:hypothetical protein